MTKAFLAVEGGTATASPRIRELVVNLADQMTNTFKRRLPSGGTLHIEEIQDQVELALMRSGDTKSRFLRLISGTTAQERGPVAQTMPTDEKFAGISVVLNDGSTAPLDVARIRTIVTDL